VFGTLRRDCLDHVIVLGEQHLRCILRTYLEYYHGSRTHLALGKDTPERRKHESPNGGKVIALPMVGGLHHRYTQRAA
jgi:putative transposase